MTFLSERIKQIFSNDKVRRIVVLCGLLVMLLLLLSSFFKRSDSSTSQDTVFSEDCVKLERELEERLSSLILQIDGVGKVSVMVTIDRTERVVYEKNSKSESKENDYSEETEVVLAGSSKEPLKTVKIMPVVRSAAIVCEGASDPIVRGQVANIAAKALNIGISKVYVAY